MESRLSEVQISSVCKLIHHNFDLPVHMLDEHGQLKVSLPAAGTIVHDEMLRTMLRSEGPSDVPLLHLTNRLESYIEVRLADQENGYYYGSIVVGPSLYARLSDEVFEGLVQDNGWPDRQGWRTYYDGLPVISKTKQLHQCQLIYFLLYRKNVDLADILRVNQALDQPLHAQGHIDLDISNRLHDVNLHQDTIHEKRLLQMIREGRRDELAREFSMSLPAEGVGTLAKRSLLRNQKNLTIVVIALATRAAVDGGLHPEIAYTMSDLFIQQAEELTDVREVSKLMHDALFEYADRVRASQADQVSNVIAKCKQHMFNRLYEGVTLDELAELTKMNASYLSRLFKKEVGLNVSEYMQLKRIDEAKKLLTLTDYSLSDICARLNFNDQSYFTKVFKKVTGVTPRQYRNGERSDQ
ncbi:AraC-like DNA-binding protein [Paenibacillus phyllosphaerae]|uniref:AraC-like DNA-binding protein n=1 Tax=Paenibacillus phyllosphaerae TaxID=274593 RepID=A0A7W5AWN2_9BACL|nr:helix-turn-helix domain-containing protein [Paenibacillus phyllosphaerae]MBB3110179.1 AraC-like DNA-binding protein [Paenibacillus phyllosphaerae]